MSMTDRHPVGQTLAALVIASATAGLLALSAGCSQQHGQHAGYSDQSRTQIQFYSPPGASVTVKNGGPRARQIATYGPFDNRLEQSPEEFAIFNLSPGRYEFKYTSADGLPGVSLYGELDVRRACSKEAKIFRRRAFIPISLPSEHYRAAEASGDEIFPYRGEAYRTVLDETDLQRLKQGDVVEKVLFVADLERAADERDQTLRELKVCERKIEYAEARFRLAYQDFQVDVADPMSNLWGSDKNFIRWESERQELDLEYQELEKKLRRLQALLKGDHVVIRKGMLVLATEEVVRPYRDVVSAAAELGEVMLVMRVGGRHMHWGNPAGELAVYEQE